MVVWLNSSWENVLFFNDEHFFSVEAVCSAAKIPTSRTKIQQPVHGPCHITSTPPGPSFSRARSLPPSQRRSPTAGLLNLHGGSEELQRSSCVSSAETPDLLVATKHSCRSWTSTQRCLVDSCWSSHPGGHWCHRLEGTSMSEWDF